MMARMAPWLAAAAGFALTLATFWPGYMSYDAAYQWWQARHAAYTSVHPPLMSMLWAQADRVLPGPGLMFATVALLYWSALALAVAALRRGSVAGALLVLGVGAWPPLFALLGHVWKDVGVMALFALAVGALLQHARMPRRHWLLLAAFAVLGAALLRHNASVAALPLVYAALRLQPVGIGRGYAFATACVLTIALAVVAALPNRLSNVQSIALWPSVALWDLAAVSVAEDRQLVPARLTVPGTPDALYAAHVVPYSNVPLFGGAPVKLNFDLPYDADDYTELRDAWLALPVEHPRAYAAHRWALAQRLFGWRTDDLPESIWLIPWIVEYRDNPPVAAPSGALHAAVQPRLTAWTRTPLFAGWLYAVLAAGVIAFGARHATPASQVARSTAASALLYAAPLLVIAGSAEFRYLSWLLLGAVLGLVGLLAAADQATKDTRKS